jgi:hypothetical protein
MTTEPSSIVDVGAMGNQTPAKSIITFQDGQVYVDGKVVTGATLVNVERDVKNFRLKDISWRSIEKLLAYGSGIVAATNGFAQLGLPTNLRNTLLAVSAAIVASLHITGPAATKNTSTS